MAHNFSTGLQRLWYAHSPWCYLLLPLALLFQTVSAVRRFYYLHVRKPASASVPVIVVGNISVGGTGKTPLLIALATHFSDLGLRVGVISRGYNSNAGRYPYLVNANSPVAESGDEALLIAKTALCPVVISPQRNQALRALLQQYTCDVVLSDDGLQHYALARDFEIAVIDGSRGIANGLLLPAGPLRESPARLNSVNCVVVNGPLKHSPQRQARGIPAQHHTMTFKTMPWRRVIDDGEVALAELSAAERVHAVAGIGNPQRFFRSLKAMNLHCVEHSFTDHHKFQLADILFNDGVPVVMTAKDAVKCQALLKDQNQLDKQTLSNYWYVPVLAQLPDGFYQQIVTALSLSPRS